jgi:hypothetical protein
MGTNLRKTYALELERTGRILREFPWESREAYASWCAQTYHYVCHSTRLLATSAGRIPLAHDEFYNRYVRHLQEEKGHEKLALRDLEKLGYSIREFPEEANTAAFYQTQYFSVEHVNPYALLGYILILEGLAASFGPGVYKRTQAAHGKEASTFWKVHAEDDPDHLEQAFQVIEKLDPAAVAVIQENLRQSSERYGVLLETAARAAGRDTEKKAA